MHHLTIELQKALIESVRIFGLYDISFLICLSLGKYKEALHSYDQFIGTFEEYYKAYQSEIPPGECYKFTSLAHLLFF